MGGKSEGKKLPDTPFTMKRNDRITMEDEASH